MATASFCNGEGGEVETFDPLVMAEGRLATVIFEKIGIALEPELCTEIVFDLLPFIHCYLALSEAEGAMTEIGRRTGRIEESDG